MFGRNVDSIVKPLGKMVDKLNSLVERNEKSVEVNRSSISRLEATNSDLRTDSDRASSIAEKINDLIG